MLSRNQIRSVTALHSGKFRKAERLFIAEGEKIIRDLIRSGWKVEVVYCLSERMHSSELSGVDFQIVEVSEAELSRISAQKTPQGILAVVQMPEEALPRETVSGLNLVLDDIRDPGNMGTILRVADWFGIEKVYCSNETADCYNPKVVQASMGSIFRVPVVYTDLPRWLNEINTTETHVVYGAFMKGENLFEADLTRDGLVILGNESAGVSDALLPFVSKRLFIPSFAKNEKGSPDSLNVSVAAAIISAEFRRRL